MELANQNSKLPLTTPKLALNVSNWVEQRRLQVDSKKYACRIEIGLTYFLIELAPL